MNSVLAKLAHPLRRGEVEDLRGLVVEEPLELEGAALPHLDFTGTTFNAPVALRGVQFQGLAWFIDCTFNATASFAAFLDRMTCYGNLSLDRTRFAAAASLQDSECFGGLWCNRTIFAGRADMRGLEVHGRTWLVGAAIAEEPADRLIGSIRSYGYLWV